MEVLALTLQLCWRKIPACVWRWVVCAAEEAGRGALGRVLCPDSAEIWVTLSCRTGLWSWTQVWQRALVYLHSSGTTDVLKHLRISNNKTSKHKSLKTGDDVTDHSTSADKCVSPTSTKKTKPSNRNLSYVVCTADLPSGLQLQYLKLAPISITHKDLLLSVTTCSPSVSSPCQEQTGFIFMFIYFSCFVLFRSFSAALHGGNKPQLMWVTAEPLALVGAAVTDHFPYAVPLEDVEWSWKAGQLYI